MLRNVLLILGSLALAGGLAAFLAGAFQMGFSLLGMGLVLTLGILYERWRYKPLEEGSKVRGRATGERFIDPETGELTEVYFDAQTGERRYVKVRGAAPP